jgi:hypothetical protein
MTTKAIIFIIEVAIMLSLVTTTIVSIVGYARQRKVILELGKLNMDLRLKLERTMKRITHVMTKNPTKKEDESEDRYLYRCRITLTNRISDMVYVDKSKNISHLYIYDTDFNEQIGGQIQ